MKFYDIDRNRRIKIESYLDDIEILLNILTRVYLQNNYFLKSEEKFIKTNIGKINKKIRIYKKQGLKKCI